MLNINIGTNLSKNIIGSFGLKFFGMLISLLTLPAYLNYFQDKSILGSWFAILSILNWVLTFDLGVGNGMRNYIVKSLEKNDFTKAKAYISSSYFSIGILSIIVLIIGFFCIINIEWNELLNISRNTVSGTILTNTILITFFGIIFQLNTKLISSILHAIHLTAISNLLIFLSNLFILIFLYFSNPENSSLITVAWIYLISFNLPLIFATLFVFKYKLFNCRPGIKYINTSDIKEVLNLGVGFLIIQLSLLFIHSTNQLLISKYFSSKEVVDYQIYYKVFSILTVFFTLITVPLWSSVSKAFYNNNISWIFYIYKRLNILAIIASLICFVLAYYFQYIVDVWLNDKDILINNKSSMLFASYISLMIFILASTCIANAISKIKPQLFLFGFAALIKIPLTYYLLLTFNSWDVIVLVNIIILIPVAILQPVFILKELKLIKLNFE